MDNLIRREITWGEAASYAQSGYTLYAECPVPQEEEVVRWECPSCGSIYTEPRFSTYSVCGYRGEMIVLKGKRPVKPKLKRREEIKIDKSHGIFGRVPSSTKIYCEWEE